MVITAAAGLVGTLAIPAYASTTDVAAVKASQSTAQLAFEKTNAQSIAVESVASIAPVTRDAYTTTSKVQAAAVSAIGSTAARSVRAASVRATAVNPGLPAFSLDGIVADASQYIGTPYVYGGSTPAGFDCSGFVLFLYSHVGISLAHNARIQGESGTVISQADARPGDLVIFYGGAHDGIYYGNNQVLDAPKPGGRVGIREIWTSDVFFVRLGI